MKVTLKNKDSNQVFTVSVSNKDIARHVNSIPFGMTMDEISKDVQRIVDAHQSTNNIGDPADYVVLCAWLADAIYEDTMLCGDVDAVVGYVIESVVKDKKFYELEKENENLLDLIYYEAHAIYDWEVTK